MIDHKYHLIFYQSTCLNDVFNLGGATSCPFIFLGLGSKNKLNISVTFYTYLLSLHEGLKPINSAFFEAE